MPLRCCITPRHNGAARSRTGVVLLVVLSMLTLFLLLGTTYIVIATRAKRSSASIAGDEAHVPREVLVARTVSDTALTMLLNGSAPNSNQDSLLRDMYGDAALTSPILSASRIGTSHFYRFGLTTAAAEQGGGSIEEWGGRIATLDSGRYKGTPFRIIGEATAADGSRQTSPALVALATETIRDFDPAACVGAKLSINGQPFSNTANAAESYDGPDDKNLFLAFVPPESCLGPDGRSDPQPQSAGNRDDPADGHRYIIPSFHRPDAILKAVKDGQSSSQWPMLRPRGLMSFRHPSPDAAANNTFWTSIGLSGRPADPSGPQHPAFTGSNVSRDVAGNEYWFDPINGPWDVDNDADGVTDSVWIDVGAEPVILGEQWAKPLVALLVIDMDGRINLNAHGSLAPVDFSPSNGATARNDWPYAGTDGQGSYPANHAAIPSGLGYGPADVQANSLFDVKGLNTPFDQSQPWNTYAWKSLLVGAAGPLPTFARQTSGGVLLPALAADGRYGESPASIQDWSYFARPGWPGASDTAFNSPEAAAPPDRHLPNRFGDSQAIGSPIDPRAITSIGLDAAGQPFFTRSTKRSTAQPWVDPWQGDTTDDPYDLSLSRKGPRPAWTTAANLDSNGNASYPDNLYTANDLERLLRMYDSSASRLPPRIMATLGPTADRARLTTTTDSWDTTALVVDDPTLLATIAGYFNPEKLQTAEKFASFLSWDLALGMPMDINRPFGDGVDSDGNNVVDEPTEVEVGREGTGLADGPYVSQAASLWGLTNGRDADGQPGIGMNDQLKARQLFAKHLYCLGRIVLGSAATAPSAAELAQWCVNVVDFRDPDSIMTRFDYDPAFPYSSPTNLGQWNPTKTVWGLERPECLLTEAIGWNNVSENALPLDVYEYTDLGTGGFFVELYHPWTGRVATDSGELLAGPIPAELTPNSNVSPFSTEATVSLAPASASRDPAFQIVVVKDGADLVNQLAEDPARFNTAGANAGVSAIIYPWNSSSNSPDFSRLPAAASSSGSYYTGLNAGLTAHNSLAPGQFAIVGGGQRIDGESAILARIGRTTSSDPAAQKGILLSATGNQWVSATGVTEETAGYTPANRVKETAAYPQSWVRGSGKAQQPGPLGALLLVDASAAGGSPNVVLPLEFNGQLPTPARYRVLLRRLANPLLRFHANDNPYITIDSLPVQQQVVIDNATRPGAVQLTLRSAQRGWSRRNTAATAWDANNLWRADDADSRKDDGPLYPGLGRHCGSNPNTIEWTLGFFTPGLSIIKPANKTDDLPFPWLTWNNREYVSPQELLLVPKAGPATLFREFSTANPSDQTRPPFPHLFFDPEATAQSQGRPSRNRLKLLDWLAVRSRFADSADFIPTSVAELVRSETNVQLFYAPHNYLADTRQAGRINVNTIADSRVWDALGGGRPMTPYRDEVSLASDGTPTFVRSEDHRGTYGAGDRRKGNRVLDGNIGEDVNADGALDTNDDANNDDTQDLGDATLVGSRRGYGSTNTENKTPAVAGAFDLLATRKDMLDNDKASFFSSPFTVADFPYRLTRGGTGPLLLNTPLNTLPYNSRERSPWFRYQSLMALGPNTTVRSNVYAVWMTIGFFRLNDSKTNLFEEADVQRVRYFSIIDRSIPAAYSANKGFDAAQVIVIRRFLP